MRFTRITIFILIAALLLEPFAPAMVQAVSAADMGFRESDLSFASLPPFPEDANRAPIDWSETDWDKEAVLPKDREEFDAKLRELESQQKYGEISQLQRQRRLWSDDAVMAYYQVPLAVQVLVRGYRVNAKKAATPAHQAALKSFLSLRIKSILLAQNYYPPDFNFDNNSGQAQPAVQKFDIRKTAPLKIQRFNGVQKPDGNNIQFKIKSLLQNPSNANWWQGKVKKPGKKVSWSDQLLWLVATPAEAYYQPTTPLIEYYDGIANNPVDNALYYLAQTQNEDGSWGDYSQYELTAWLTFVLSQYNKTSNDQYTLAVNYVKNTTPKNTREKAVKAWILIGLGEPYQSLLDDLLASQNSDGGYGLADNYASDVETTLDVLAAFWKANATVLPASLSYVLAQIQADGSMRYTSEASPSYFLMNKTAEYLKPFGQVSQPTQVKLNLLTNYLAGQYNLEEASLANTNDVVDELMTLQTLKSYSLSLDKQISLIDKIITQQAGSGSFGNTLHAQLAAFKALAQSDLVITDLQSTGILVNGQLASFDVTIKNIGYLASGDFKLYHFVDDYKINDGFSCNSLSPGGQAVITINFDPTLTRSIIGDTAIKLYVESDNEFNYANNWKTANFTFAPHASGWAALPLYYMAQRYSVDGLPAINFRYLPKADPNRINYVFMWRLAGETQWDFSGIDPNRFPNGVFLHPFANNATYEITVGALRLDGISVDHYTSDLTTVKTSADDIQYAGNVTGYVTVDNARASNVPTFGYNVSGRTDGAGEFAYNNAPNGTSAAWVDDDIPGGKQYDALRTKFTVLNGGTTNNVRLFTHLTEDATAPTVSAFYIGYVTATTYRNQNTVHLLGSYNDNVWVKDADFYYFDPAESVWLYLGTEATPGLAANFEWYIPANLLGSGYKVKTIAHDYRGNASVAQEWGPFTIVDGSTPGGSIQVQDLANNNWAVGQTKTIAWNYAGANALQRINSITLWYGPASANNISSSITNPTFSSIDYALPAYASYVSSDAFVRITWCDVNNNCSTLDSDHFSIVDLSPPPAAPWGVPQVVDGIASVTGIDRYIQQVFSNADGSTEVIYTEFDGQPYTDPGQYRRIVYRKLVNGIWQTPIVLKQYLYRDGVSLETVFDMPIQAVKAANGDIHIAYTVYTSTNNFSVDYDGRQIHYLHLANGVVVSDRDIAGGGRGQVAVNDQNRVFITWKAGYNYAASSGISTLRYIEGDGVSSWASPAAITSEATGNYALALEQGAPVVVYYKEEDQHYIIKKSGGSWSAPAAININTNDTRDFNLFSRGQNVYELFYLQSSASLNWHWGISFTSFHLDDASHTTSILQNRDVIPNNDAEDVRIYRILSEASGQYHILYNKMIFNNYRNYSGYVFFDGNGPHFNARISPLLASIDEGTLFGSVRNNVVTEYFSSFTNGVNRLQFNQADLATAISQLPPAVLTPVVSTTFALQDNISSASLGRNSTHQVVYTPGQSVVGPGELRLNFAPGFDLTSAAAVGDLAIAGGGVNWATPVPDDIHYADGEAIFRWTSGTLTPGVPVKIKIAAVKNPATAGSYSVTAAAGPNNFTTAYDQQTANLTIGDSIISVTAFVPYPLTNPTVTNIAPLEAIIISSGATQVISFTLADVNNDSVSYTLTPSTGSISVSPNPPSPLAGSPDGQTINFTYFANGATGSQTITITADDNEAAGGGVVTYEIQLFII